MTREEIVAHMKVMGQNAARMDDVMMYVMTRKDCEVVMAAAELLEAQEPRKPHYTRLEYMVNGMPVVVNHPECPKCVENGLVLWDAEIEKGTAYCKRCGQAVKWDG